MCWPCCTSVAVLNCVGGLAVEGQTVKALGDKSDISTLRPRQDDRLFQDDIFKYIFLSENVYILNKISLKFIPKGAINNIPALV